jgi:hypothetical protein
VLDVYAWLRHDAAMSRAAVFVTAAALVVGLASCSDQAPGRVAGRSNPIATSPGPKPTDHHRLPEIGGAGFPRRVFPKPGPGGGGSIPACPAPTGLEPFSGTAPARAAVIWASVTTRTFAYDLHHTDRAWWSNVRADWRDTGARPAPPGPDGILYAGSLRLTPQFGVPRQYGFLRHYCGAKLANASYAIVSGPRRGLALQGVEVFLNRDNHVLLYYEY